MKTEKLHRPPSVEGDLAKRLDWKQVSDPEEAFVLASRDGRAVIGLKLGHLGVRDLHAAVVRLALSASRDPRIERAILLADFPRMSATRLAEEWQELQSLLRPEPAQRMAIVGRAAGSWVVFPEHAPDLDRVLEAARATFPVQDLRTPNATPTGGWTPPRQGVFKILLNAWLQCEPALPIGALAKLSGCSLPTVNSAIAMLNVNGEIQRTRSRGVTLAAFPRKSLNEVLLAARHSQDRIRLVDQSGRPVDLPFLLKRLEKLAPKNVALGGVVAARTYMPNFDLNGLPRLDVKVLSGDLLTWVNRLDPALKESEGAGQVGAGPILVIHRLPLQELKGNTHPTIGLPLADRAETLFDLYDLGLGNQAEEFVHAMRTGRPASV